MWHKRTWIIAFVSYVKEQSHKTSCILTCPIGQLIKSRRIYASEKAMHPLNALQLKESVAWFLYRSIYTCNARTHCTRSGSILAIWYENTGPLEHHKKITDQHHSIWVDHADNRDIPAIHIFHYIFHCAVEITNQYGGQLSHCAGGRTIWRPQCHHRVLVQGNVSLLLNHPHEATAHESFAVQLYMAWVLCIFPIHQQKRMFLSKLHHSPPVH